MSSAENAMSTTPAKIEQTDFTDALLVAVFHLGRSFYADPPTLRRIGHIGYALFKLLEDTRPAFMMRIYHPPGNWEYAQIENEVEQRFMSLSGGSILAYWIGGYVALTQDLSDFSKWAYRIPLPLTDWIAAAREANERPLG